MVTLGGNDRSLFKPIANPFYELIGEFNQIVFASVIFDQLMLDSMVITDELFEMSRTGAPKFINILIVITDSDDAHYFVVLHQRTVQSKFVFVHILYFLDDQNRIGDTDRFVFVILDVLGSPFHVVSF